MDKMMQTKSIARALKGTVAAGFAAAVLLMANTADAADRPLGFAVKGVVAEVLVKAGQSVNKGQVLARLEAASFAANAAAAKAAQDAAKVELKFAASALDRAKQLFDDLSASAEEVERAEIRLANAKRDLAKAKARHIKARWSQSHATLRAPSAATVVSVPGYVGQAATPCATGAVAVVVLSGK